MFDLNQFTSMETDQQNQTISINPDPDDYKAILDDFGRVAQFKDKETGAPTDRAVVDISWLLLDPDGKIKAKTNREKNYVKQALYLDLSPSGGLDFGTNRNIGLGRLRDALGQNVSGQKWNPGMMKGQIALVKVIHEPDQDKPGVTYAKVKEVTKVPATA